ncbi:MAG: nitroreductase [Clostridiales bacterium]|nr:nitroreductase [Clostridiales bacterium]
MSNQVLESILTRRSVRSYKSDPVPKELLDQVLKAGTYAATGMGRQSPIIVAVTDKAVRDRLSAMNAAVMGNPGMDPFYGAPVVLVVLADKSIPTHVYDGSLVMGNLMQAAHAVGLSSCWIHRAKEEFETDEGKELLASLGIRGDYEGIGHCILGYADGPAPRPKPRKDGYVYRVE